MSDVAVLGGGSWGTSLAHLAAQNGRETLLWVRDPAVAEAINARHVHPRHLGGTALHPGVRATLDLAEALRGTPVVVFAVPSSALRAVADQAGQHLRGEQVVLSAIKGLEPDTFLTMSEVIARETCARKVGALSGPNLAKEIVGGQPAATVVASHFPEAIERGTEVFHGPLLRVYGSPDLKGVELAGALKNVIAIACGVADGLGYAHNVRALLVTRGLAEIQRLGVRLGADALTFSGLAGFGDLMVTCSSPLSRNFRVGQGLAAGSPLEEILAGLGEVAEGVNTTRVALALGRRERVALPITEGLAQLLFAGRPARDLLDDLMTRRPRYEVDFDYTAEVGRRP